MSGKPMKQKKNKKNFPHNNNKNNKQKDDKKEKKKTNALERERILFSGFVRQPNFVKMLFVN